jgi:hypothetical protein
MKFVIILRITKLSQRVQEADKGFMGALRSIDYDGHKACKCNLGI